MNQSPPCEYIATVLPSATHQPSYLKSANSTGLTLESVPGCRLCVMRAGQLANAAGVSTDTLRHYERIGILPMPPRTAGNYRDYPENSLDRVRLIQRALGAGFSLAQLASILKVRDKGGVPCQTARAMAEAKLRDVKLQIRELQAMRRQLGRILKDWKKRLARTRKGQPAKLLESLPDAPRPMRRGIRFGSRQTRRTYKP